MQKTPRSELITVPKEEEYIIPDNCWAIEVLPDGKKVMLTERSVKGGRKIFLFAKIKGG